MLNRSLHPAFNPFMGGYCQSITSPTLFWVNQPCTCHTLFQFMAFAFHSYPLRKMKMIIT